MGYDFQVRISEKQVHGDTLSSKAIVVVSVYVYLFKYTITINLLARDNVKLCAYNAEMLISGNIFLSNQ